MGKTYGQLPEEGRKTIDEWQRRWADKSKGGEWKAGVEAAKAAGRTPGAGIAVKLGLTPEDMAHSVTEGWKDIMGEKTEADHERGIETAVRLNKWRDRWLFRMTVQPKPAEEQW